MQAGIHQMQKKEFPPQLLEIPEPPKQLFIQGELPPPKHKLLAVVGSRKCTAYGREVVEALLGELEGFPVSIVSGLALGIDACAHKAALKNGLHTIAIPGSGLGEKVLYPRSHVQLAKQIVAAGGALLSEYGSEQEAAPWTFPKRNRIMAGLADAVLVVEAAEKSGTLITARLAVEYNRELLVVPASIFANSSKGALQFLKLGATPVTEVGDILSVLGLERKQSKEVREKKFGSHEQEIWDALHEPCSREELLQKVSIPVSQAQILLSKMELQGDIKESLGVLRRA